VLGSKDRRALERVGVGQRRRRFVGYWWKAVQSANAFTTGLRRSGGDDDELTAEFSTTNDRHDAALRRLVLVGQAAA
jgi:hypothetical protein